MSRFTCDLRPVHRFAIHAGVAFSMMLGATLSHADTQTLTAGSPPSRAPATFMDVKTQKTEGLMPAGVHELGGRQGVTVRFEAGAFSALVPSGAAAKTGRLHAGLRAA